MAADIVSGSKVFTDLVHRQETVDSLAILGMFRNVNRSELMFLLKLFSWLFL